MPNLNTHDCVKNIRGSEQSKLSCRCGSWITHWRNYTGSKRQRCAALGCNEIAKVGGHVISVDKRKTNHRYIVPLLYGCNHHTNKDGFFIEKGLEMV